MNIRKFHFIPIVLVGMIFSMVFLGKGSVSAQSTTPSNQEVPQVPIKVYKGFYRFKDEYGDSVKMYVFVDFPVQKIFFKNKKEEEYYWRTVRDVKKTLPYAKLACKALKETYEYIQTIPDQKEREKHLKTLEKDIVAQYKPAIMKMTKGQGKVLLKLINRETQQSSYNIVKAFLGSFRAAFWNTFGSFFGMNMKSGFHPESNHDDLMIDLIAEKVELGIL